MSPSRSGTRVMKMQRSGKSRQRHSAKSLCASARGNWKVTDWSGKLPPPLSPTLSAASKRRIENKTKEYCKKRYENFVQNSCMNTATKVSECCRRQRIANWQVTGRERERERERKRKRKRKRWEDGAANVTGIPVCCRAHFLTVNIAGRTKPL